MTKPTDNQGDRQDATRISGATRRIVVEDLPPEEPPRARGRKRENPNYRPSALGSSKTNEYPNWTRRPAESVGTVNEEGKSKPSDSGPGGVNVKRLLLIIGGMVTFAFVISVALVWFSAAGKNKARRDPPQELRPTQTETVTEASAKLPAHVDEPNRSDLQPAVAEVQSLSVQLASQISQKAGYEFEPEFVELIRERTHEYNNQKALSAAKLYRREINKAFRDEGLNPLIGYALALSRSKFDANVNGKGIGLWQIPASIARSHGYLGPSEDASRLKTPEASAQISAAYTKALLSTFDSEDFMYAIACFGMSLQEAGLVQARLVKVAPDSRIRRDIMKGIRAGVLNAEQVDNIVRFFAAGIVGENPQKFGLDESHRFSSLY